MENPKITEAQRRMHRGKSIDVAFMFNRRSSCEMQNQASPCESGDSLVDIKKRLQHKSWAIGATRRTSLQPEKKRSVSSKPSFDDRRPSQPAWYNGHRFEKHKTGRHVDYMKMNVPKRWLREYEQKQVSFLQSFTSKLLKDHPLPYLWVSNNNKHDSLKRTAGRSDQQRFFVSMI